MELLPAQRLEGRTGIAMEIKRTITRPAREEDILDHVLCDLCRQKLPPRRGYDIDEVTIKHREGVSYPEGGNTTTTEIDLCTSCFTGKLLKWFAEQGVQPRVKEDDF